jgi:hypothetical protein
MDRLTAQIDETVAITSAVCRQNVSSMGDALKSRRQMREVIAKMGNSGMKKAGTRERFAAKRCGCVLPPYLPKKKCKVQS